jgi:C4-dicarboxylate-specific signal transduction histidine kinase
MDRKKILYVDDEPVNLSNFRLNFGEAYEVITASSGKEAFTLFKEHVDKGLAVVVADNRMPVMSGVELMEQIYHADPDPVRIILTAFTNFEEIMKAVNKGHIYQYILKPWNHHNLRMCLDNAVHVYSMIKTNKNLLRELSVKNIQLQEIADRLRHELKRRQEEEVLRRSTEVRMLGQAKLASLGEMATGIAHEINQPLFFLKIVMEAAKRDIDDGSFDTEEFKEDLDEFLAQAKRIETIIKHLQTFGRKSGNDFNSVQLPQVLNDSLIPLNYILKEAGVGIEIDPEADLPPINGVATRLEQVFINLFNNAIDAMENSQEKKISIRLARRDDSVVVTFSDSGCGMPAETVAKIFEPFFTTKEVGKGTGLGLSIAYGIIQEHNGSITCHSKPGEGTSFILSLPVG